MKVVITGPESTGKSKLAKGLAQHYQINQSLEYAREYLQGKEGKYEENDLLSIAVGQIKIEDEILAQNQKLTICDTSLEVIRIWSEVKYGRCDPFIVEQTKLREPDLFLLLKPDFPWQPDPLRESPDDRDELFTYYKKTLSDYNVDVVIISGNENSRITSAINAIEKYNI